MARPSVADLSALARDSRTLASSAWVASYIGRASICLSYVRMSMTDGSNARAAQSATAPVYGFSRKASPAESPAFAIRSPARSPYRSTAVSPRNGKPTLLDLARGCDMSTPSRCNAFSASARLAASVTPLRMSCAVFFRRNSRGPTPCDLASVDRLLSRPRSATALPAAVLAPLPTRELRPSEA